ncbi:hypothetical protein GCM10008955_01530 [Deinococcus malanensis]|uniref:Uncharacterized protein n=1 Tax=Deinococcus malanensis TaxID=1706855 RepID=A0ABQ2EGT6_9DEIO|nr:hypothetical protein [Deinococcus malanensis]GGK11986.1 hypothetical protein GCM10008955_01530 [Deinococcus malanensis]
MNRPEVVVVFWPSHAQLVVFDPEASPCPDEAALWAFPGETGNLLSVRRTLLSVGLPDDGEVNVTLRAHTTEPGTPHGTWSVMAKTTFLAASGVVGVGDVVSFEPVVTVEVPPGPLRVRVAGDLNDDLPRFQLSG